MREKGKQRKRMKMRMGGNKKEERRRERKNEFIEKLLRKRDNLVKNYYSLF